MDNMWISTSQLKKKNSRKHKKGRKNKHKQEVLAQIQPFFGKGMSAGLGHNIEPLFHWET